MSNPCPDTHELCSDLGPQSAVRKSHNECLKKMVNENPHAIEVEDEDGLTPLLAAIVTDNIYMIDSLVILGVDVNNPGFQKHSGSWASCTPLGVAGMLTIKF